MSHGDFIFNRSSLTKRMIRHLLDSTRNVNKSSGTFNDEEENPTKTAQVPRVLFVVVIILIILLFIFIALRIYMYMKRNQRRRILEETRRKMGEAIITAGSVTQATLTTSKANSTQQKSGCPESNELKQFTRKGPLVMQAILSGEVKHALDNSQSKSIREPLQFDPSHNEIVYIGTDVDRIIGKSVQGSNELVEESTTSKDRVKSSEKVKVHGLRCSRECVTQSELHRSEMPLRLEKTAQSLSGEWAEPPRQSNNSYIHTAKTNPRFSGEKVHLPSSKEDQFRTNKTQKLRHNSNLTKPKPSAPVVGNHRKSSLASNNRAQESRVAQGEKGKAISSVNLLARTPPSERELKVGSVNMSKEKGYLEKTTKEKTEITSKKSKKDAFRTPSLHATQDEDETSTIRRPLTDELKPSPVFSELSSGTQNERHDNGGVDELE
ncbi:hypothetical protein RB195_020638 [Necator americanus]|uniref:Uncharacterized protein n=1 Tax=Necator americanus TaxID=51031 RepID=A0ABR1CK18_NECAM